jgi:hypothetical protein
MTDRIRELKLQAGIQDNPDQEGLDLFAELLVAKVLADHCACYKMGYHRLNDYNQISRELIAQKAKRNS